MNPTIKNALNQTVAFLTNSVIGVYISRAVCYSVASVAFIVLVYAGLVLGMDIPQWRMNGETGRIYAQVALCVSMFVIGMGSFIASQMANSKLVALTNKDDLDEDDAI